MILRRLAYGFSTVALSVSSLFILASPVAHAASVTWDGGGGDNNFSTAANWSDDTVPVNGDVLTFSSTGLTADVTLNNDLSSLDVGGIVVTGGSSWSYTIAGNTFTVSGDIDTAMDLSIATNLILGADISVQGYGAMFGDVLADRDLNLNGHTMTIASQVISNSEISGSGNLIVSPNSFLYLKKASTFTGNITLNGGMGSQIYAYDAHSLGNSNNTVTINGEYANITFCGLNGATISNNFVMNNPSGSALVSVVSCGMGAALTESNPLANVTIAGAVTLQQDTKVGSGGVMTLTGPLSGAHTVTIADGWLGSLVINSSNNTSNTPNGNIKSAVAVTEVTDKQPSLSVSASANEILVIKETGERGDVIVNGGTLKGTGKVGNISLSSGTVAPGLSPGVLNSGNFTATGGSFDAEIGGTAAGEYDQLNVTGTVSLGSATTLNVTHWNGYRPAAGNTFVIINNDGSDAVTGTFQGLAQGATFTVDGVEYAISYTGGDGNDVVLTVNSVSTATAPNTGFAHLSAHPIMTMVVTLAIVAALGVIARKQFAAQKD